MKFTANRDIVLALGGHVLALTKNQTAYVPPILRPLAVQEGLDPVDAKEAADDDKLKAAVKADEARVAAVKQAMMAIKEKNDPKMFDASGTPTAKAIEALGGVKPANNDERVKLWGEVASAA